MGDPHIDSRLDARNDFEEEPAEMHLAEELLRYSSLVQSGEELSVYFAPILVPIAVPIPIRLCLSIWVHWSLVVRVVESVLGGMALEWACAVQGVCAHKGVRVVQGTPWMERVRSQMHTLLVL